jgi:hypothetical protein
MPRRKGSDEMKVARAFTGEFDVVVGVDLCWDIEWLNCMSPGLILLP